ncbi:MAG: M28 family metallopeptidase [Myxococcota bacterium]
MLPPLFDIDRMNADVHWLVNEVGPRVHRSSEERAARDGVSTRLLDAGWAVKYAGETPIACRGNGGKLFLAHIDTVPNSPGAVDNAGAVAILLELARTTEANDLCLAFPVGEENGLYGSRILADSWNTIGLAPLELIVSLDLIGDGTPTAIDLNTPWGSNELDWLQTNTAIDVPYLHRTFGRALPQWRSDHAHFVSRGLLGFNLITRSESGVFAHYHQASDTTVRTESLVAVASDLEGMATASAPTRGDADPAVPMGSWVFPGWATWLTISAGLLSGLAGLPKWKLSLGDLARAIAAGCLAAIPMLTLTHVGFPSDVAELTAHTQMGIQATGWWTAAPFAIATAWLTWLWAWRKLPGKGDSAFPAAIFAALGLALDPLVALPFALAAILVRIHRLFGLLPLVLLLRPEPLRELSFHGLLEPVFWPVIFILAWPAFGRGPNR